MKDCLILLTLGLLLLRLSNIQLSCHKLLSSNGEPQTTSLDLAPSLAPQLIFKLYV